MATPGIDDSLHEVVVHMRHQQQEVLNVWHFQCITAVDDLEVRLLRALLECYLLQWLPHASSGLTIERVSGMQVGPTLGPMYEIFPGEEDTVAGAATGGGLPTHDSCSIRIHTTRPGRSGRGRKQMPGVPEIATNDSVILTDSDYWEAILAFIACVMAKFVTSTDLTAPNTILLGLISKTLKPHAPDETPKAPWPLETFARCTRLTALPKVGTTNSRKVGRGS